MRRVDVWVSIAFVLLTMVIVVGYVLDPDSPSLLALVVILWVAWALVPPAYFLAEWSRYRGLTTDEAFLQMKYSHELASKFWLGGVTVLSAVLIQARDALGALRGLIG